MNAAYKNYDHFKIFPYFINKDGNLIISESYEDVESQHFGGDGLIQYELYGVTGRDCFSTGDTGTAEEVLARVSKALGIDLPWKTKDAIAFSRHGLWHIPVETAKWEAAMRDDKNRELWVRSNILRCHLISLRNRHPELKLGPGGNDNGQDYIRGLEDILIRTIEYATPGWKVSKNHALILDSKAAEYGDETRQDKSSSFAPMG